MFPYLPNFNPQKQIPAISVWGSRQLIINSTVLRPSHISLRKVSMHTRARTQKSCTVSQLVCAFPNPV
jgi:hypothetical protein